MRCKYYICSGGVSLHHSGELNFGGIRIIFAVNKCDYIVHENLLVIYVLHFDEGKATTKFREPRRGLVTITSGSEQSQCIVHGETARAGTELTSEVKEMSLLNLRN